MPVSRHTREVSPIELFFDLVFAFGISQLSHHLLEHLSWRAAAESLVMLIAVLTVWSYTSWAATMVPPERPSARWMILLVMLLGLFMNAGVSNAFASGPWGFVAPLLLIQLGRTVWTILEAPEPVYRSHYLRVLAWFTASTPLWIAGAMLEPGSRVIAWAVAGGIELLGTWLAHPIPGQRLRSENVRFDAEHMVERCRLFLLIALGETVLTTGAAVAQRELSGMAVLTGTFALAGTTALWSLAFGRARTLVQRQAVNSANPIRVARYALNVLMVMVAGLVAIAVGNEVVIEHPSEHASIALVLLLCGGPILYLCAQAWYLWTTSRAVSAVHLGGSAALVGVALGELFVPAWCALGMTGAVLVILGLLDPAE
jgi:low temperature requirement protein LtrA